MSVKALSIGFMLALMGLLIVGLVTIYSTTSESGTQMFKMQCLWIGIGLLMSLVIAFVPLEVLAKYSWVFLLGCAILLFYLACARFTFKLAPSVFSFLPFVSGKIKGSFRWLTISGYGLQPSEFAKFSLLLFLSSYYGLLGRAHTVHFVRGFLVPVCVSGTVLGLIALGQDLSTTVVTAFMVGAIMFCAGVRVRHLALLVVVASCLAAVMVLSSPERRSRLTSFRHPEVVAQGDGYQLDRSQTAMGGGGLFGRGYTQSIMKHGYLPEKHTDFILAVWGEEMGFVGILAVLLCYLGMMVFLMCMSFRCREIVCMLICIGLCMLVTFQSMVNVGVITGAMPTTGLTAPFISYGGSSMLSMMMCVGLVFNVFRRMVKNSGKTRARGSQYPTFSELKSVGLE